VPGSSFEDLYLVNPAHVRPVTADEVAALESELGVRMPTGYAEYVQRTGEGALGHFLVVHAPAGLPERTLEWRKRIQEYWFWDTSEAGITPEALQQDGVLVANTSIPTWSSSTIGRRSSCLSSVAASRCTSRRTNHSPWA
jgi:hypothetical protein